MHTQQAPKYIEINPEMVIGLKNYPDKFIESFDYINGYYRCPMPVRRFGLGSLGRYQPQDVGKRFYFASGSVESTEQVQRRTGRDFDAQYKHGLAMIRAAKKKYKGQATIWATKIYSAE